jgi:ribonuclease T1
LRRAFAALAIFCVTAVLAFSGEIRTAELPAEARQALEQIKAGGPFSSPNDGRTFGNREAHLPKREHGYYREFTVPTPGARDRGARRIVAGRSGEFYYTEDHYRTFKRIIE